MLVETILTPEQKRYRHCCGFGCCHVRTCVFVIGILELIALGAAVVTLFVLYELTAESFTNRNSNQIHIANQNDRYQVDNVGSEIDFRNFTTKKMESSESSEEHGKGGISSDSSESDEDEKERKIDLVYLRAKHRYYVRSMVGAAAAFVVGVFVVALMFTGLVKRRSRFLLPHLGVQILAMVGLVIVIILYSIWCASVDQATEAKRHLYPINQSISCWLIIGSCTIALVLEIISFWNVLMCYRFLRSMTQIQYHSDTNRFLTPANGKHVDNVKWTHRCATAPGGIFSGNKV